MLEREGTRKDGDEGLEGWEMRGVVGDGQKE